MNNQMQMIGTINEFNSILDDWNVYYERLEQFFEVNDVAEEKRSAFLISVIGADAYKSLRDLCHPYLPKDKPFESLCELLRKQFSPQVSIFRERVNYYNARQEYHENATQWYGRLKRLSVDCKFGSTLEPVLVDKFITGLRPGQVLDRLCEENETLKLEQALDIAVNKECAAKDNAYAPHVPTPQPIRCGFGAGNPRLAICPPAPFQARTLAAPPQALCGPPLRLAAACPVEEVDLCEALEAPEACGGAAAPDGVPEGADRVGAAAAKGRNRTRRRGRGRRGAAGDAGDQHSVVDEGEC